jgi:hypothetical protein
MDDADLSALGYVSVSEPCFKLPLALPFSLETSETLIYVQRCTKIGKACVLHPTGMVRVRNAVRQGTRSRRATGSCS